MYLSYIINIIMIENLPIYKLILSEDEDSGVELISLVDNPAISINWIKLSKEEEERVQFSISNPVKHIISGPLLIPNQPIYRFDKENKFEYYVTIDEQTVEKVAHLFNKNMNQQKVDVMHNGTAIDDVYMVENWIVESPENDKSSKLGFNLPAGTWFASYKIDDIKFWDSNIANDKLRGFSIDGHFLQQFLGKISIKNSETKSDEEKKLNQIIYFLLKN